MYYESAILFDAKTAARVDILENVIFIPGIYCIFSGKRYNKNN